MLTKRSHPGGERCVEDVAGADDVGLHGLGGVLLEHRQVLERGRVEDDVGSAFEEDPLERGQVADVAEHHVVGVQKRTSAQRELDGVQGGLVAVEHHQLGGGEPVDLAAQLGPDRAAGAGDEHPPAGQVARDRLHVGVELVAAEQVGEVQVADVADADVVGEELGRRRQDLEVHPEVVRGVADLADQLLAGARHRQDHGADPGRADHVGQVVGRAADRHSPHPQVSLARVVVDHRDR